MENPYWKVLKDKGLIPDQFNNVEDVRKAFEEAWGKSPHIGWIPMLCWLVKEIEGNKPQKKT